MAGFRIAHYITPDPTPKRRPAKSKDYLAFVHNLPCVVTGVYGVQAAHLSIHGGAEVWALRSGEAAQGIGSVGTADVPRPT